MEASVLKEVLQQLLAEWEKEVTEFKQAENDYDTDKIGRYFSALSNEANLANAERAWLVFGVENKTRTLVGSDYRPAPEHLHSLKKQIADGTEPSVHFRGIYELDEAGKRIILFEIPAAPRGIPIAWKGHYYARAGESLVPLGLDKQDQIRQQTQASDWSAQVVPGATLEHLDERALEIAKKVFAQKHAHRFQESEVFQWSDATFLERIRLSIEGKMTRAALLLLGKPEAAHYLLPHPAQMTWKLEGAEHAYTHFGPPFFLNTTALYQKIRNVQVRVLPEDALLPVEVSKYDQQVVLEALHNCIAHQDYTRHGRIVVIEQAEKLIFENEGSFFEGAPDDYAQGHKTPRRYRNPFLAQTMVELNMIDTMGYGIHRMLQSQARRYFPLPDYDLSTKHLVRMVLYGAVVDPAYSRLLIQKTNLPLTDVMALDRVQKKLQIDEGIAKKLRRSGLIEGRKPNFYVSAAVAKATVGKADYIRMRAQDDAFYAKLLVDYLQKFDEASRAEINQLLLSKLSEALSEEQKLNKINNLLTKMRRAGVIANKGSDKVPRWKIAEKN